MNQNQMAITQGIFQSTPSAWRTTKRLFANPRPCINFNPRPPNRERHNAEGHRSAGADISIHALRMEGDSYRYFPRSMSHVFQSTPSVWRATRFCHSPKTHKAIFNPHPPNGGRLPLPMLREKLTKPIHLLDNVRPSILQYSSTHYHQIHNQKDFERANSHLSFWLLRCDGFLPTILFPSCSDA